MTHDRRRALIALLDQYPLERDLYLHDGRRECSPREEFADKIEALYTPSLFQRVMEASETYVKRFGGELSIEGALLKVEEEYAEFLTAVEDYVQISESGLHAGIESDCEVEAAKEAIDLLVTIGGLLAATQVRYQIVEKAAHFTLDKLDTRKEADYVWDPMSKTVIKRSKLEAGS